jgi:hypothetical protein
MLVGQSRANCICGRAPPSELVFIEWVPGKEKNGELSKLVSKEQIKECLLESTRAVVSPDGWKLCLRDKDKNEPCNLRNDPDERHNLYYGQGQPELIDRLTHEIHLWQQRVGDTLKFSHLARPKLRSGSVSGVADSGASAKSALHIAQDG